MKDANEFFAEVNRRYAAELDVCCDALLQAGWPVSRMLQIKEDTPHGHRTTIALRPGVEFASELHVFVAGWDFIDGNRIATYGTWLASPVPTPAPSTAVRFAPKPTWCGHCEREISTDTCWCGEDLDHEAWNHAHSPVPMGCACHHNPDESGGRE